MTETAESDDSEWYTVFKATMESLGLEAPKEAWDSTKRAGASILALAGAVKVAPNAHILDVIRTIPRYPVAKTAGGVLEVGTTAAGYTAAAYVGACIGAFMVATMESTGMLASVDRLFRDIDRAFGAGVSQMILMEAVMTPGGSAGEVRMAADIARRTGGKP